MRFLALLVQHREARYRQGDQGDDCREDAEPTSSPRQSNHRRALPPPPPPHAVAETRRTTSQLQGQPLLHVRQRRLRELERAIGVHRFHAINALEISLKPQR